MALFVIPTCRRPELLERSLRSVVSTFHGDTDIQELLVLDDTIEPHIQEANRRIVTQQKQNSAVPLSYFGLDEKKHLLRTVVAAIKGAIPNRVIRFALFGSSSEVLDLGSGGNRNIALLLGAGKILVSMDDDARFEFLSLRDSRPKPHRPIQPINAFDFSEEYHQGPADTLRRIRRLTVEVDTDVPSWMISILKGNDSANPSIGHHIRAVMTGVAGNRWYQRIDPPFHSRGSVRDQTVQSRRRYGRALVSGYALMQSQRLVASDSPFFVSCCHGLDCGCFLPPFPPDVRSVDTIFALLLRNLDPIGRIGHLPLMVKHDLDGRRPDRSLDLKEAPWSNTEIVKRVIIDVLQRSIPLRGQEGLVEIGRDLKELSSMPRSDWYDYAHTTWCRTLSASALGLEQLLIRFNGSPSYWAEEIRSFVSRLRSLKPVIIPESYPILDRIQNYMGRLGELYEWWPDIWNVAKEQHQEHQVGKMYSDKYEGRSE